MYKIRIYNDIKEKRKILKKLIWALWFNKAHFLIEFSFLGIESKITLSYEGKY